MKDSHSSAGIAERDDGALQKEDIYTPVGQAVKRGAGRWNLLAFMRRVHLYLGMFSAPALLFFAFTGILQTLSLHEFSRDGSYQPPRWIVVLAQIHKKQTPQVLEQKLAQPANTKTPGREKPKGGNAPIPSDRCQTLPMKVFFVIIGVGLIWSVMTGMIMAWKFRRDRGLNLGLFIAGAVVPILLLAF